MDTTNTSGAQLREKLSRCSDLARAAIEKSQERLQYKKTNPGYKAPYELVNEIFDEYFTVASELLEESVSDPYVNSVVSRQFGVIKNEKFHFAYEIFASPLTNDLIIIC